MAEETAEKRQAQRHHPVGRDPGGFTCVLPGVLPGVQPGVSPGQGAPGVKITQKSFGRERRYPIVNAFREIE